MSARIQRILASLLLAAGVAAWPTVVAVQAMPADPNPREYVQPDGNRVTIRLRGDEWQHWYEDEKGFAVVQVGTAWHYARLGAEGQLEATDVVVGLGDPEAAGLRAGLRPTLNPASRVQRMSAHEQGVSQQRINVAPTGLVKNLVVLCRFSDHTVAANGRAVSAYDSLFNNVNSTGFNAPSGSVKDFYSQASYNTLVMQSTVAAWVTLPQTQNYYGNGKNGLPFGATSTAYPRNAARMVRDALDAVDANVNFNDFDLDLDGYVDAITFVHSGLGGEQNGNGLDAIWSHKYNLSAANAGGVWTSADQNVNHVNIRVDLYHTEPARFGAAGSSALLRVGVVAHELGHFFGLPDLYDTDNSSFGIGNWCMMANSWGWDGSQFYPPLPSAWCRIRLGWVTPVFDAGPAVKSLRQVATFKDIMKIGYGFVPTEYLLIENRQPVGFDQQIPSGGLAVWHIDEAITTNNTTEGFPGQAGWPGNNNHFKIALLQADGLYHLERNLNGGDAGDLFRSRGDMALSEATVPSSDSYQVGEVHPTGDELSEVSGPGSTMTFRYRPADWVDFTRPVGGGGLFNSPFSTVADALDDLADDAIVICKGGFTTPMPGNRVMRYKSYGAPTTFAP